MNPDPPGGNSPPRAPSVPALLLDGDRLDSDIAPFRRQLITGDSTKNQAAPEVFAGLRELDTATIFNAVIESRGGSQGGRELEGQGGMPFNYMRP